MGTFYPIHPEQLALETARERLLKKVKEDVNLPTLGAAIAKVIEITSSGDDQVSNLAHFVLSDLALTQKILRLSNTIHYRSSAGVPITTVSRAIFLLGFNTVKTSAMAMLMVDGFHDKRQVHSVTKELAHSLCASIMARELAQRSKYQDSEEASVAALFKNIGRVLVASFDHQMHERIQFMYSKDPSRSHEANELLLGCTYERFAETVLHEWSIPETIIAALVPLPGGELKKPQNRQEWLRQVASFSDGIAALMLHGIDGDPKDIIPVQNLPLYQRFAKVLELDVPVFEEMLIRVEHEFKHLISSMNLKMPIQSLHPLHAQQAVLPTHASHAKNPLATTGSSMTSVSQDVIKSSADFFNQDSFDQWNEVDNDFLLKSFDATALQSGPRHPSGKPMNARDLLLAGLQDVSQMMALDQVKLNDMILLVLETLYAAMGFRFATVCLRDVRVARYLAKISMGEDYAERQKNFNFPIKEEHDIFFLAMKNNLDVFIADASESKIYNLLPQWHIDLLPDTRSFIILPLILNKKALGFFYADRIVTATEGVPPDETALIKTLKSQLLASMMRS